MSRKGDKNQTILKTLLKDPQNNTCADCKTASHPRWASWNLGIFICIRCSGIHRSMGTHISRVKSVDLDTWTDEQVRSMVLWGNAKANEFWESGLPNGYIPDDSKIENFIRTKYDLKKWSQSKTVPNPSTLTGAQPVEETAQVKPSQQEHRRSLNGNLLDLEFGAPVQSKPFQSTQSLPSPTHNQQQRQQSQQFHNPPPQQRQQPQPPQQNRDRPELKKSILSLYSTPLATNSTPNISLQQQHQQFNSHSSASVNQLGSLNFSSNNSSNQWNSQTSSTSTLNNAHAAASSQWNSNNQWSTVSSPGPAATAKPPYSNGLDDDLFKNVWK